MDESNKILDVGYLHNILEILNKLEAGHDVENLNAKISDFYKKMEQTKTEIDQIEYIRTTKEYQEAYLECLTQQLNIKEAILQKYNNFSA